MLWRSIVTKKIGDKSCQSNFDTRASDFGSFLVKYLITTVPKLIRPNNTVTLSTGGGWGGGGYGTNIDGGLITKPICLHWLPTVATSRYRFQSPRPLHATFPNKRYITDRFSGCLCSYTYPKTWGLSHENQPSKESYFSKIEEFSLKVHVF